MSDAPSPVTLIVKAPNQQIEDHTVECELSWTVRRLKGHLSEVYPNHPRTEEQRLIYSGHLLNDGNTLGEILRTTDGQNQHTLHLVCTSLPPVSIPNVPLQHPDGLRRRAVDPSVIATSSSESVSRETTNSSSVNSTTSSSSSSFDVRQIGNVFFPGAFLPQPSTEQSNATSSMGSPLDQGPDFQNMQTQYMAWVQQAYAQYMMQYMQFMVANGGQTAGVEWSDMANIGAAPATPSGATETERYAPVNGAAAHREPVARQDENVANDDELANRRDWLEWMYFMFRITVLFMLVYAYSSPLRFAIVAILGMCVYLYQRGYFRLPPEANYLNVLRVPDNNNEPNVVDAAEQAGTHPNAEAPAAPVAEEAVPNNPANTSNSEASSSEAAGAAATPNPVPAEPARPSLLALTWAFFTCFFTSIIPDRAVIP